MKNKLLYENFQEAIRQKIPKKANLANTLMDMLYIEREAVYRRLRGEVPFTFSEIATIAQSLNISIDSLIGTDSPRARPFQLKLMLTGDEAEHDNSLLVDLVELFEGFRENPDSFAGEATNILPQTLYFKYEYLTRFFLFKWKYQYGKEPNAAFSDVNISPRMRELQLRDVRAIKFVTTMDYILDNLIFYNLTKNIRYFVSVKRVTPEEAESIKCDLLALLNDLEIIAATGRQRETGNRVRLFISRLNFDASYCFVEAENVKLSLIKAFLLNAVISYDEATFIMVKDWFQALRRQSVLITETSEIQRVDYFSRQRRLVNSIK